MIPARKLRLVASAVTLGVVTACGIYVNVKRAHLAPELRSRSLLVDALESGVETIRRAARDGSIQPTGIASDAPGMLHERLAADGIHVVEDRILGARRTLEITLADAARARFELEEQANGLRFVTAKATRASLEIELRALLDGVR